MNILIVGPSWVGDMVMAFWGAPLDDDNHAAHAIAAALEMQQVTARLSATFTARGWPAVAIGVGINQWQMLRDFARAGDFDCFHELLLTS